MDLDSRDSKIIEKLREFDDGEGVAIGELEQALDLHRRTLLRTLKDLMKKGVVARHGKGRGTRYQWVGKAEERPSEVRTPKPLTEQHSTELVSEAFRRSYGKRSEEAGPFDRETWEAQFIAHNLRLMGRWVTPGEIRRGELSATDQVLVENHRRALDGLFRGASLGAIRDAFCEGLGEVPEVPDEAEGATSQPPVERAAGILVSVSKEATAVGEALARVASLQPLCGGGEAVPLPLYSRVDPGEYCQALERLRAGDPRPVVALFQRACLDGLAAISVDATAPVEALTTAEATRTLESVVPVMAEFPEEAQSGLDPRALVKMRQSGMDFDEYRRLVSLLSKNPELRAKFQRKVLGEGTHL